MAHKNAVFVLFLILSSTPVFSQTDESPEKQSETKRWALLGLTMQDISLSALSLAAYYDWGSTTNGYVSGIYGGAELLISTFVYFSDRSLEKKLEFVPMTLSGALFILNSYYSFARFYTENLGNRQLYTFLGYQAALAPPIIEFAFFM